MLNYNVTAATSDGVASPFTKPVNASGPTSTDGTEFSAELLTQTWGAFQSLLAASGFAPSGTADTADASETLDAIVEQAQGRAIFVKESGGSAANAYLVVANNALTPQGTSTGVNGKAHSYFTGMTLSFDIAAPNTNTSTVSAFGLGVQFIKRPDGSNVVSGDLSGRLVLRYDGSNFVVQESGGQYVFDDVKTRTIEAETFLGGKFQGEIAPAGFLISNGYVADFPFAGDLTLRSFSCDVAGVPVIKTVDTVFSQLLVDTLVTGWYAITVDQAGNVAVLGTPSTPMAGLGNVRPTGGGSDGTFGFDKYRDDLFGYYFDATTRIIGSVRINISTDSVAFVIDLGNGSDERGDNSRGDWIIKQKKMTVETVATSNLTTDTALGNVWVNTGATSQVLDWPVAFSEAQVRAFGSARQAGATTWASMVTGTNTQGAGVLLGVQNSAQGNLSFKASGTPLHLA